MELEEKIGATIMFLSACAITCSVPHMIYGNKYNEELNEKFHSKNGIKEKLLQAEMKTNQLKNQFHKDCHNYTHNKFCTSLKEELNYSQLQVRRLKKSQEYQNYQNKKKMYQEWSEFGVTGTSGGTIALTTGFIIYHLHLGYNYHPVRKKTDDFWKRCEEKTLSCTKVQKKDKCTDSKLRKIVKYYLKLK